MKVDPGNFLNAPRICKIIKPANFLACNFFKYCHRTNSFNQLSPGNPKKVTSQ